MTWPELEEQTAWPVAELIFLNKKEQLSSNKENRVWLKLYQNSDRTSSSIW